MDISGHAPHVRQFLLVRDRRRDYGDDSYLAEAPSAGKKFCITQISVGTVKLLADALGLYPLHGGPCEFQPRYLGGGPAQFSST